ncbi:hypothetical protein J6590_055550 [Homalodisca vitripennis]|nr:hypothetical protein J6590_055550 [Homalodisca vitripennis]
MFQSRSRDNTKDKLLSLLQGQPQSAMPAHVMSTGLVHFYPQYDRNLFYMVMAWQLARRSRHTDRIIADHPLFQSFPEQRYLTTYLLLYAVRFSSACRH